MAMENLNPKLWIRIYNSLAKISNLRFLKPIFQKIVTQKQLNFLPHIELYSLRFLPKNLIPALSSFSYNYQTYLQRNLKEIQKKGNNSAKNILSKN